MSLQISWMKFVLTAVVTISTLTIGQTGNAERLQFASIFTHGVVLQRDRPVAIWGRANPGARLKVTFSDQAVAAQANEKGEWSVTLEPIAANSAGQPLEVSEDGGSVIARDVVVGEVWHASGQSNMAMTVAAMAKELPSVKKDVEAADLPSIRFCRINHSESDKPLENLAQPVSWIDCDPATMPLFSGVAFYFASELHRRLGVPIGVIDTSRGGTPIEPFIPRVAFTSHATLRRERELGDQQDFDALWRLPGGVRARDTNWLPGRLFHSRLAPLARFEVRGAIWYQGESNSGDREDPRDYQHKMRALINGWRTAFGNDEMPFYFVQLPGSGAGRGWPYLREQQRLASDVTHTGMVVTLDIQGKGIHPANKMDVGKRLANWALAKDYQIKVAFNGPVFNRQEIEGDKIVLHFKNADGGLMIASKVGLEDPRETPKAKLAHFELTDKTGIWYPADAIIVGEKIVVTARNVTHPIVARYAYSATPENCNLYNREGLPASPFCTRSDLLQYDPDLPK